MSKKKHLKTSKKIIVMKSQGYAMKKLAFLSPPL